MPHTALTPVFTGLRTGLHLLFVSLAVLVIARAVLVPSASGPAVVVLTLVLLATYAAGAVARRGGRSASVLWLTILSLEWVALLWLTPEAAYLVFPLFFLSLHLLGSGWGATAIVFATAVAIGALGLHGGWTVGGVVGPLIGACVALLIGLGYEALAREARQREVLMQELIDARGQLAATERESGMLAERSRLAREIHDTLAQGLSSIQILLHAAERADPGRPGIEHVRLARETAAANLADARRFIRELTPSDLEDRGLGGALRRLAAEQWEPHGLPVDVQTPDGDDLPMPVQTALLRIAQGAIANVLQHAGATRATIRLELDRERDGGRLRFTVSDDGRGFDPAAAAADSHGRSDSFGLRAIRERVDQLGGVLTVDSAPGAGSGAVLTVDLPLPWAGATASRASARPS